MADPKPDPRPDPDPDASNLTRDEIRTRNRAIRERWAVPPELLAETLYQVQAILADRNATARDRIAAGRLLATLTRVDQVDDRLEIEKAKLARPDVVEARDAWQDLHDEIHDA